MIQTKPIQIKDPLASIEYITCACDGEGVSVESEGETVSLAFWSNGFNGKDFSLLARLKFCWLILTKGTPWTDMVILDQHGISNLVKALLKRQH